MEKSFPPNNLDKIFQESLNAADFSARYASYIAKVLSGVNYDEIANASKCLINAREKGATIFLAGNGGSAATASHFAQDLVECARKAGKGGFKAVSLADNVSFITALGNDFGYDTVFTGQLKDIFKAGDVLIAISVSGNSLNIIECVKFAKEQGGACIGLTGFDGGSLSKLADYSINAHTPPGEYGPVESIHSVILHMISNYIYFVLKYE